MNSLLVLLLVIIAYFLGYRFYSNYIAKKVLVLDPNRPTPSRELNDGVDFVPTRPPILFGHHFASIAGLGPIVGPAIAVIYGWVPAILWIVLGSIFIGAVHDFVVLGISIRHKGRTIGDIADDMIGPRGRVLFLLVILFALLLVAGVFVLVISDLFSYYGDNLEARAHPEAVVPSFGLILVAITIGLLVHKFKAPFKPVIIVGIVMMFILLALGIQFPVFLATKQIWIYLLLGYAFCASVLPVWVLLQPRDFLSSFNLYAMLFLLVIGFLVFHPGISAPALNTDVLKQPDMATHSLVPFLFITIACGAVSGFHCMVSSGTTSKQLRSEPDARAIGYGGMITESFLAVLVVLACTAGYSLTQWNGIYDGWIGSRGLGTTLGAFVTGAANIVSNMGIPLLVGQTFLAVTIVSFAMTTLDTCTRLIRFTIQELFGAFHLPKFFLNRYVSSAVAIGMVAYFALMKIDGRPAGIALWTLFGTTNQLLAGTALLVATIYFFKQKKPTWLTFVPMAFMLVITALALTLSLKNWWVSGFSKNAPLIITGSIILCLLVWLVTEAIISFAIFSRQRNRKSPAIMQTE